MKKDDLFWFGLNLPLQVWNTPDTSNPRILNYMPRKERLCDIPLEEAYCGRTREEFFEVAARVLENLAKQMRDFGAGKVDHVYYPDHGMEPTP